MLWLPGPIPCKSKSMRSSAEAPLLQVLYAEVPMVRTKQQDEQQPQVDEAQRAEAEQLQKEIDDLVAGRATNKPSTLRDLANQSAAERFRSR